jgi:alkyldihydroxyacetonephosphate synthase
MKRWNGWGDTGVTYPLHELASRYIVDTVGPGQRLADATFEEVVGAVPASRLPAERLLTRQAPDRVRHARGQSLPDWIALRSGQIGLFPDGVAYPTSEEDVRRLLAFARQKGIHLIPYGGGTSVVGHINPLPGDTPVLTVDLVHLNQLTQLDETSHLATFGAGVPGPDLETQLRARGYTLGHYPQSYEYSTLGGWIAARSSGQQSYYYGRIEDLFAGGHVETPLGSLDLPPLPASAAGPDLRQFILGSEGRFGIITSATIRIRPLPAAEGFFGAFFRDWQDGVKATRELAQLRAPLSMIRLSDGQETATNLALAGDSTTMRWAERGLRFLRYSSGRCLLLFGVTGSEEAVKRGKSEARQVIHENRGLYAGAMPGRTWRKSRFLTPYLRNTLWEMGYAVDTLETALPWAAVPATAAAVKQAIQGSLADSGEKVLVFAHLSHFYSDGASIYVTYLFRRAAEPQVTLERWQKLKAAASEALVAQRGTISHQHGVGFDHLPYLAAEKGAVGMTMLEGVRRSLDPDGILNPGKLLPDPPPAAPPADGARQDTAVTKTPG